jgi:hypothetical protein
MRNLRYLVHKGHDFCLKDFRVIGKMSDITKAEDGVGPLTFSHWV